MVASSSSVPIVLVGSETDFVPQAFQLLEVGTEARPFTACASCPSAIWFEQDGWRCFCNIMKFLTWEGESKRIAACDGREAAVARYEAEKKKLILA